MVTVRPSSYGACGKLVSTREALELQEVIAVCESGFSIKTFLLRGFSRFRLQTTLLVHCKLKKIDQFCITRPVSLE